MKDLLSLLPLPPPPHPSSLWWIWWIWWIADLWFLQSSGSIGQHNGRIIRKQSQLDGHVIARRQALLIGDLNISTHFNTFQHISTIPFSVIRDRKLIEASAVLIPTRQSNCWPFVSTTAVVWSPAGSRRWTSAKRNPVSTLSNRNWWNPSFYQPCWLKRWHCCPVCWSRWHWIPILFSCSRSEFPKPDLNNVNGWADSLLLENQLHLGLILQPYSTIGGVPWNIVQNFICKDLL